MQWQCLDEECRSAHLDRCLLTGCCQHSLRYLCRRIVTHRHAPRHEREAERQCIGLMSRSTVAYWSCCRCVSRERSPRDFSMPRSSTTVDSPAPSCRTTRHDVLCCCAAWRPTRSCRRRTPDITVWLPSSPHHAHSSTNITSWRPTTNRQHHESVTAQRQASSESVVEQHHVEQRQRFLCLREVGRVHGETVN